MSETSSEPEKTVLVHASITFEHEDGSLSIRAYPALNLSQLGLLEFVLGPAGMECFLTPDEARGAREFMQGVQTPPITTGVPGE